MRIGELAKLTGLSASRIRFYEAAGLLGAVERKANGYRRYPPQAVWMLEIITRAQRAGFSLDQIRHLLPVGPQGWRHDKLVEALRKKVAEIELMAQQLAQSKAQLLGATDSIENRPEGIACSQNTQRVLDLLRLQMAKPTDRS